MKVGRISVDMKPINQILKDKGLTPGGAVQTFHTANVLRRIQRYMPYRTGMMIKRMEIATDVNVPEIVVPGPEARYTYFGKKMVDSATGRGPFPTKDGPRYHSGAVLMATEIPLNYTKTKNPLAGPFWDKRLVAAEGKAMTQDLQRFIDRRAGK